VTQDPRYVRGIANARSSLTVPLRLHDKVIGAFNVESEKVNAFTEEDRQFAEMVANHVALALHILDLLVVERRSAGEAVTGSVEGELSEPLNDILHEIEELNEETGQDAQRDRHIERIRSDVEAIRRRVREAAQGPQHILGAEKALSDVAIDPELVGKRVLVADDESKMRQTIREILRARGCVVVVCENGQQAIEALEAVAAGNSKAFDLLVSDIRMPDRNGYEVFAAGKRTTSNLPTILMTGFGYDPHHSIVRASQEGLQAVLFKPFQAERLIEEVKKALATVHPAP
jgi:CheY-like chemotaxis protein